MCVALVLTSAYSQENRKERPSVHGHKCVCVCVERCGTQELMGQCLWVFSENNAKRGYDLITLSHYLISLTVISA